MEQELIQVINNEKQLFTQLSDVLDVLHESRNYMKNMNSEIEQAAQNSDFRKAADIQTELNVAVVYTLL